MKPCIFAANLIGEMNSDHKDQSVTKQNKAADNQDAKLLGMLSHNFKGPLSYLHNMITFLNDHQGALTKAELKESMALLQETSASLNQMITKMFYWALKQQELFSPQIEQVEIPRLFGTEVAAMRNIFEGKKVHLGYFHTGSTNMASDAAILSLIIQNLLSNALKFSTENAKTSVRTNVSNNKLAIEVMDEGIGMDASTLQKLREGIVVTTTGTAKEIGTGLGLRMVGELVKILNGTIEIKSKPDLGTTFIIVIPHAGDQDLPQATAP